MSDRIASVVYSGLALIGIIYAVSRINEPDFWVLLIAANIMFAIHLLIDIKLELKETSKQWRL